MGGRIALELLRNRPQARAVVETKDYLFGDSKDEIVAKAKQEGKLEVLTFLEADAKKVMVDALQKISLHTGFQREISAASTNIVGLSRR